MKFASFYCYLKGGVVVPARAIDKRGDWVRIIRVLVRVFI
jgi:predicted nicotinamide N-methyase